MLRRDFTSPETRASRAHTPLTGIGTRLSRVMHLYVNVPINYAMLVNGPIVTTGCAATAINCNATANTDARRVLSLSNPAEGQYVGNMDKWDPSGTQRYAGMTLSLEHKISRGMSMNANWT